MPYQYERSARVPGEFPETDFDRFTKNVNYALVAIGNIEKRLVQDKRPRLAGGAQAIKQKLLEVREDMLWLSTTKGDDYRPRSR